MAQAVSSIGQIVLILCKLLAGAVVFGLILTACMLIIGLFAIAVGGRDMLIMSTSWAESTCGYPSSASLLHCCWSSC